MIRQTNIIQEVAEAIPFYREEWFLIVFGALVATLLKYAPLIPQIFSKKKQRDKKMVKALKASSDTFATMDVLRKLPGVDQAILLEVSNNGGVPKPGHKIYTRAIDAKVDGDAKGEKRKDLLDKYDEFRVDQQYIDMVLATKQSQKPYKFETATHENCILRTIYIDRKVAYSEIYHIFSDTRKWRQIILSIQTNDHNERFECKEVRAAIELCVRRIQHNFETWG